MDDAVEGVKISREAAVVLLGVQDYLGEALYRVRGVFREVCGQGGGDLIE